MKILAIESSCDETAAAVIGDKKNHPVVISNVVASQIDIHAKYGGVVPEVAARAHIENIIPVIDAALKKSGTKLSEIDRIAVTQGPGLIGSLVVGVETAKALSQTSKKPIFPIHHLEGHIYANFLSKTKPKFPVVALVVSGGHTSLIYLKKHLQYEIIGKTRDDAAGEAFDKAAKILGLPYPGGPEIAKAALRGNDSQFIFPIIDLTKPPKRNAEGFLEKSEPSLDFSFSGLKTALISIVKKSDEISPKTKNDLAASFQKAIISNLLQNSKRAVTKYKPRTFILSGGVAANTALRATFSKEPLLKNILLFPEKEFCTDNAAMIGAAAFYRKSDNHPSNFPVDPNLELKSTSEK